jgi:hypothetical protein
VIVIDNNAIHIVDAVMGTGKTQACIAWMRQHPEQKYLYVTPYLDECKRIQEGAPELDFREPQEDKTKSADLLRLLSEGQNITTTHELFRWMKDFDVHYIKKFKYVLFIDEELSSVENISIPKHDFKLLLENRFIQIDSNTKEVSWIGQEEKSKLAEYKEKFQHKPVYLTSENILMWLFPLDILKVFEFPIPVIKDYLENDKFKYNEDDYALSALLQWIWRSAIRNGKKVKIYIPSPRMRQLLTDWLNG